MRRVILGLGVLGTAVLAGCTTMSQPSSSTVPQLQTRVGDLERQLDMKDQEISDLKYQIRDLSYEVERVRSQATRVTTTPQRTTRTPEVSSASASGGSSGISDGEIIRVEASVQELQQALQKAGYYEGSIDGKLGSGTKAGISNFQKDHGLTVDGIVGKKTWEELKVYLN